MLSWESDLSGINSTIQGNPPSQATSGAAMALLVSQSLQFTSGLSESHNQLLEKVGGLIISHLQTFAKTPRIALIVGEANRPFMKEFSGSDISMIKRVTVEESNPMANTISGRLQIADSLLEKGLIKNTNEYISILNGGVLESSTFGIQASSINIKAENEALQEGTSVVRAMIIDNPMEHILSHRDIISSPESRLDDELVGRVLDHIQDHFDVWINADPIKLQLLGIQPPTPEMLAQFQGQGQGEGKTAGNIPNLDSPSPAGPPDAQPMPPRMPSLPAGTDPSTTSNYEQLKGEQV
jgi:hypothetical protein